MKLPSVNITSIWPLIAIALIFSLLTLQVESCFHNSKPNSEYKKEIADKDKQIQDVGKERDAIREKYDSAVSLLTKRDTVLIHEYKTNTVKYEKIPVYIISLNKDSLRAAGESD